MRGPDIAARVAVLLFFVLITQSSRAWAKTRRTTKLNLHTWHH
jgi:hypothetical protein